MDNLAQIIKEFATFLGKKLDAIASKDSIEIKGAELITIKGEKGDKGDKGDKGEKGEMGDVGEKGEQGETGKQGEKGDKGDKGEDGKDSTVAGPIGLTGKTGAKGKDGKDGSPDTGDEIIGKINKSKSQIDAERIKDLWETVEELGKRIKTNEVNTLALGGMGTPLSQSFSCNGVLTAFTLSRDIGGEGKALWAHYNGQWLVPTTHFTISGRRIINTTFTPEDGTTIDVLFFPAS